MWKKKTESSKMYLQEGNGVPYFVFRNLEDTKLVRHGFSTRMGGVSRGHLSELNLSFTRGDDPEHVRENFRRIAASMGFDTDSLVKGIPLNRSLMYEGIKLSYFTSKIISPSPKTFINSVFSSVPLKLRAVFKPLSKVMRTFPAGQM